MPHIWNRQSGHLLYLKKDIEKVPKERHADFKAGVQAFVEFLLTNFDDFTIYTHKDNSMKVP